MKTMLLIAIIIHIGCIAADVYIIYSIVKNMREKY